MSNISSSTTAISRININVCKRLSNHQGLRLYIQGCGSQVFRFYISRLNWDANSKPTMKTKIDYLEAGRTVGFRELGTFTLELQNSQAINPKSSHATKLRSSHALKLWNSKSLKLTSSDAPNLLKKLWSSQAQMLSSSKAI